jgi:hypothetical protein
MIPKAECKDRRLYRIKSRNLVLGVYRVESGGFLGLREKFGQVYVFEEYHWENESYATVQPFEELPETLPLDIPNEESLGTVCSFCDVPCAYVRWPEGGTREVVLPDGGTINVPGKWQHVGVTDCKKPSAVGKANRALHEWLLVMEAKYT